MIWSRAKKRFEAEVSMSGTQVCLLWTRRHLVILYAKDWAYPIPIRFWWEDWATGLIEMPIRLDCATGVSGFKLRTRDKLYDPMVGTVHGTWDGMTVDKSAISFYFVLNVLCLCCDWSGGFDSSLQFELSIWEWECEAIRSATVGVQNWWFVFMECSKFVQNSERVCKILRCRSGANFSHL